MTAADQAQQAALRHVVIVGTGGTIAGSVSAGNGVAYQAGVVSVGDLIGAVPGLGDIARVSYEQFCQIDSCDMTLERQLALARRVAEIAERDDVDGVVVTHGTDTMEETAYLLHLLLPGPSPVAVTGAMRAADAPGADGPANLLAAVRTAASPDSAGLGTLVVMGEAIHCGRDVVKSGAARDAFASAGGPLGWVGPRGASYVVRPARRHGAASIFDLATLPAELPPVETVYGRAGLPAAIVRAYVESGAKGIVYVGHGAGNVPLDLREPLAEIAAAGVPVVRTTRVADAVVTRDGAVPDSALGLIAGGDLNPAKARILLALALTHTRDAEEIQDFFDTF